MAATIALAVVPVFALTESSQAGENAVGLATDNTLLSIPTGNPAAATVNTITFPMSSTDTNLVGIDYRPRGGGLYGVAAGGTYYVLTPGTTAGTFAATQINATPLVPIYSFSDIGFDFNPAPDAMRLVTDGGQDYRFSPNNGNLLGTDTNLAYAASDPNVGDTPSIAAAGYTNSKDGTAANNTTLYEIDVQGDVLVTQGSPNATPISPNTGQLFTVGSIGVDATGNAGLDIAPASGTGYAALELAANAGSSSLYRMNLMTGAAESVGTIGGGKVLTSITTTPASVIGFADTVSSVDERAGTAKIAVTRSGGLNREVTVNYATTGEGITPAGGTLTFPVNVASQTFDVPVVNDTTDGTTKVADLTLSAPGANAILGGTPSSKLNVIDNRQRAGAPVTLVSIGTSRLAEVTGKGRVRVAFSSDRSTGAAMKLKLGARQIGSATTSLTQAGKKSVSIKLTGNGKMLARKKSKGKKSLQLSLSTRFTGTDGASSQTIKFRVIR